MYFPVAEHRGSGQAIDLLEFHLHLVKDGCVVEN